MRLRTLLLATAASVGSFAALLNGCGSSPAETCETLEACDGGGGAEVVGDDTSLPTEAGTPDGSGDTSPGPEASPSDDGPSNDGPSVDSADAACTCPTVPNGSATCVDGGCVTTCDTSYLLCNGTCHSESAGPSDSCVVTDTLAVFVSTGGSATGAGTQAAPVATVNQALTIAAKNNVGRIYVCGGTYTSAVTLSAGAPAVAVYGGFDCSTPSQWTYAPTTQKTVVAPTAHGYALEINAVTSAVSIEGIEFDAQSGTAAGESSIAGFVTGSTGVTLTSVTLVAGTGVTGTSGVTPTAALPVPTSGTNGADGGAAVTCPCTNSGIASVGGKGGVGTNGDPGLPNLGGGTGGNGALGCGPTAGGAGGNGDSATPVSPASGAPTIGTLASSGWSPSAGSAGAVGGPGQGGGGGGSGDPSETGGGGACGGCGGGGASPGLGGGSSIALLVYQSGVTLATSTLTAKGAGDGGDGKVGEQGVAGGSGGIGANACGGGKGGAGAQGGASGGGSGGVSVGVLYSSTGNAPTIDPQTTAAIVTATAGKSGQGGATPTNDGKAGVAKAVLAYP